eukprot:CAMPEP_0171925294 /NCGR_PEP_ID=MMETSP0993-20121228/23831_1 /TAXON_ID=483369 /ORGANISM="non described non described, Strain CCMP2098" /LENGTH=486 /DNA_ID=CAMNT_0012563825 /DNA_START=21 /DNA_END=1478 /DNA_ORIENTATION=+
MKNDVASMLAWVLLVVNCPLFVEASEKQQRQRSTLDAAESHEHWNNLNHGKSNVVSVSRVYANASADLPRSAWDYEHAPLEYGSWDHYELGNYFAHGNYSKVYMGTERATGVACVMKVLHMAAAASNMSEDSFRGSKDEFLKREISILRRVGGQHNTTRLMDVLAGPGPSELTMVLERVELVTDNDFFQSRSLADIRFYSFRMLKALDFVHSMGIMHRDFKPPNVFINAEKRQLTLGDFGGADYYWPGRDFKIGVTTFVYKAPELLVGMTKYDYGVDLWAFGCVLASWVFKTPRKDTRRAQHDLQPPFFNPEVPPDEDRHDAQLGAIVAVLGKRPLHAYLARYNMTLPSSAAAFLRKARLPEEPTWTHLSRQRSPVGGELAVDLLKRILVYDHRERLSAKEALAHPFFGKQAKKVEEQRKKEKRKEKERKRKEKGEIRKRKIEEKERKRNKKRGKGEEKRGKRKDHAALGTSVSATLASAAFVSQA